MGATSPGMRPKVNPPRSATASMSEEVPFKWSVKKISFAVVPLVLFATAGAVVALRPSPPAAAPETPVAAKPQATAARPAAARPAAQPTDNGMLLVHIRSNPVGASVFDGDVQIGTTPLDRQIPRGQVRELTFRMAQHADTKLKLDFTGVVSDSQDVSVTMAPLRAAAEPSRSVPPREAHQGHPGRLRPRSSSSAARAPSRGGAKASSRCRGGAGFRIDLPAPPGGTPLRRPYRGVHIMAEVTLDLRGMPKAEAYAELKQHAEAVLEGIDDDIARMATMSCLLHHAFGHLWTGFYRVVTPGKLLRVGPYQGTLGCLEITLRQGRVRHVRRRRARRVVVADVHAFPGHITCDGRSASEIVVPGVRHATASSSPCSTSTPSTRPPSTTWTAAQLEELMGWFSRAKRSARPRLHRSARQALADLPLQRAAPPRRAAATLESTRIASSAGFSGATARRASSRSRLV